MWLRKAVSGDCELIHDMQKRAFSGLLEKYRDYGTSPACETPERIREKFAQPFTTWWLIIADDGGIAGAVRVVRKKGGEKGLCRKGHAGARTHVRARQLGHHTA